MTVLGGNLRKIFCPLIGLNIITPPCLQGFLVDVRILLFQAPLDDFRKPLPKIIAIGKPN